MARSRFRSVRFDLEAAVALARLVDNAGGTIAPDLLAAGLGYSGTNNGTYLARLANARTFGLVGGRGDRIDLTDRGRIILAGDGPAATAARGEAFLSVPLFAAVYTGLPPGTALADRSALAAALTAEFGESADKAPLVAAKLLDSARQAGLIVHDRAGKEQFRGHDRRFTTVENLGAGTRRTRGVKFFRTRTGSRNPSLAAGRGGDMNDDQMWLDEGPEKTPGPDARVSAGRRLGVVAAAVACLALVAVPVGVALTGSPAHPSAAHQHQAKGQKAKTLGSGPAEHAVLGALSATTDSGNFDFSYTLKSTPATGAPTSTTTSLACPNIDKAPASGQSSATFCTSTVFNGPVATPVAGTGVSDTNPQAMLVGATLGDGPAGSGLQVTLRVDSTTLYEFLGAPQTGLAPPAGIGNEPGQAISSFASLTESTIGSREGAVAMLGLASPTGYLDLYQQDIEGAAQSGSSTVNGVPVTVYQVAVDPTQLVNEPNVTPDEAKTTTDAVGVLHGQGYTGTTDTISVDTSGFIREVDSVAHFSDGGTVVLDVTLSNFGCAGTVLMPGQQGPNDPPSGCTSPDNGLPPTSPSASTTTPTSAPTSTTTTTTTLASPTTVPAAPTTSVTDPNATTTTTAGG